MAQANMELSALQTCALQPRIEFEDDSDFGGHNNLAEGCSTANISKSSYAPSTYGPRTPSSGRSTPIRSASLDYASSFATTIDTPLDLTPPSSTTSTYFSTSMKVSSQTTDFLYPDLSFTPPRGQLDFSGHTFGNCGTQIASPQPTNSVFFINNYASQSFSVPTAIFGHVDQLSDSLWVRTDSPINFEERSLPRLMRPGVSTVKLGNSTDDIISPMSSSNVSRRRARIGEARLRSTALQQAQQTSSTLSTAQIQFKPESNAKKPHALVTESGCVTIENIQTGKFKCPYEGCKTRPYRRNEHLKRHIQCAHKGTLYPCDWCPKVVNRKDNWLSHIKLHTLPRGTAGRVRYEAGAVKQYEEEMRRIHSRRGSAKTKKRLETTAVVERMHADGGQSN